MVAAYLLGRWRRAGLTPLRHALDESTLITAVMVGVITGGRLGHVLLYARDEFAADPTMVFRIWQGGMASHGGFLGVLLAGAWYARRAKVDFLSDYTKNDIDVHKWAFNSVYTRAYADKDGQGTDVTHAVLLTLVAGLGHLSMGNVDWNLLGLLLIGSLPMIVLGTTWSSRMREDIIRPMLGFTLLLLSARFIFM